VCFAKGEQKLNARTSNIRSVSREEVMSVRPLGGPSEQIGWKRYRWARATKTPTRYKADILRIGASTSRTSSSPRCRTFPPLLNEVRPVASFGPTRRRCKALGIGTRSLTMGLSMWEVNSGNHVPSAFVWEVHPSCRRTPTSPHVFTRRGSTRSRRRKCRSPGGSKTGRCSVP